MTRASWKIPFINFYLLRTYIYNKNFINKIAYLWKGCGFLFSICGGKQIQLYRGNSMIKLTLESYMEYHNIGEYFVSKNMGSTIHSRNKKKKRKRS